MTEPYCWICEAVANCDMCRPDGHGQLGLFDENYRISSTSNRAENSSPSPRLIDHPGLSRP